MSELSDKYQADIIAGLEWNVANPQYLSDYAFVEIIVSKKNRKNEVEKETYRLGIIPADLIHVLKLIPLKQYSVFNLWVPQRGYKICGVIQDDDVLLKNNELLTGARIADLLKKYTQEVIKLSFLDENKKIVYSTEKLNSGVVDIIKYGKYTAVLGKAQADDPKYKVGDIVFVHHHGKNFKVAEMRENKHGYFDPVLEEINPDNAKFPISIISNHCNYPIVSV